MKYANGGAERPAGDKRCSLLTSFTTPGCANATGTPLPGGSRRRWHDFNRAVRVWRTPAACRLARLVEAKLLDLRDRNVRECFQSTDTRVDGVDRNARFSAHRGAAIRGGLRSELTSGQPFRSEQLDSLQPVRRDRAAQLG